MVRKIKKCWKKHIYIAFFQFISHTLTVFCLVTFCFLIQTQTECANLWKEMNMFAVCAQLNESAPMVKGADTYWEAPSNELMSFIFCSCFEKDSWEQNSDRTNTSSLPYAHILLGHTTPGADKSNCHLGK